MKIRREVILLLATLVIVGCGEHGIKEYLYNLGAGYECNRVNDNRQDESARDFGCISTKEVDGMTYEEYLKAKEGEKEDT